MYESTLTATPGHTQKRKLPFLIGMVIVTITVTLSTVFFLLIADSIALWYMNKPVPLTANDYLVFPIYSNDIVEVQTNGAEFEVSSWNDFQLIGPEEYPATLELLTKNDAGRSPHREQQFVFRGHIVSGKYQVVSPQFATESGGITFEVWGKGEISARLSRSSYYVQFGRDASSELQYYFGVIGLIFGSLLAFGIIYRLNHPVTKMT